MEGAPQSRNLVFRVILGGGTSSLNAIRSRSRRVRTIDPRELLVRYNEAAKEMNQRGPESLPLWSPELLQKIGWATVDPKS